MITRGFLGLSAIRSQYIAGYALRSLNRFAFSTAQKQNPGDKLHASQKSVLGQQLMLVNYQDDVIGQVDKLRGHLNEYIFSADAKPHRAFSIFLFNDQHKLLMHKRSSLKMTFPNYWTNTCCSHPLDVADEREQHEGTKLAAQRRLNFEFNIKFEKLTDLKLVDKLLYKSPSDDIWGEYELDYIFFLRMNVPNVNPNPEEIGEYQWVERTQLRDFLKEKAAKGENTTPWFQKIVDNRIDEWWLKMEKNEIKDKRFTKEDNQSIPFF